ncbi:MAG: thiamine diphosphokinase [Clostridiales bacterium]|jgi:thiamine pyrophosphokinase|nr:thiamine diphosphokinase [Clostridiales bacterium]
MEKKAVIILNGVYLPPTIQKGYVICADGGYDLLKRNSDILPDVIIGDNDSLTDTAVSESILRINFDSDKDMTDGELALRYAVKSGYIDIAVYGALGGRQDHVESNLALLVLAQRLGVNAVIYDDNTEIHYIGCGKKSFFKIVPKNIIVSIVPFCFYAHIIKTEGLKYPLSDKRLVKHSSLGISNVSVENRISVEISEGDALIFIINA